MDFPIKQYKSLPPRVDGKIHGYLRLVVDQIIWSHKSLGNASALVCWWGENDSVQFRFEQVLISPKTRIKVIAITMSFNFSPVDVLTGSCCIENQTETLYAIRTNRVLFQEYIANCESLTILIADQESGKIIGTAFVFNLLNIFTSKPFSRYLPILGTENKRIGDIHVAMKMLQSQDYVTDVSDHKFVKSIRKNSFRNEKLARDDKEEEIMPQLLSKRRDDAGSSPGKKRNSEITDNLVSIVIARAQRLRGAIKNCQGDDVDCDYVSPSENGAKSYRYIPEQDMNFLDKLDTLKTVRDVSPALDLINCRLKTLDSQVKDSYSPIKPRLKAHNGHSKAIDQSCTQYQNEAPGDYSNEILIRQSYLKSTKLGDVRKT